jgi:ubiquitin carboxyl-terminal hydrolase L3
MNGAFRKQVAEYQALMEITEVEAAETKLFALFLSASVELCWERLWRVYYSDEVWKSQDAAVGYVPPDKRATPSYIEDRLI